MDTATEQVRRTPEGIQERSHQYEVACCPECSSLVISRVKRSFFQKITSRQMRFYCHDCHALFWRQE